MVNIINLFRKLHRNTYWLMKKHSCLLEVTRQWYKSFRLLGIFSHNDLASANKRNYDNKLLPKELANLAGERIKKKKKKRTQQFQSEIQFQYLTINYILS